MIKFIASESKSTEQRVWMDVVKGDTKVVLFEKSLKDIVVADFEESTLIAAYKYSVAIGNEIANPMTYEQIKQLLTSKIINIPNTEQPSVNSKPLLKLSTITENNVKLPLSITTTRMPMTKEQLLMNTENILITLDAMSKKPNTPKFKIAYLNENQVEITDGVNGGTLNIKTSNLTRTLGCLEKLGSLKLYGVSYLWLTDMRGFIINNYVGANWVFSNVAIEGDVVVNGDLTLGIVPK